MAGKLIAIALVVLSVIAGGGLYYLQVYHFYSEANLSSVGLTLQSDDTIQTISARNIQAIDATSSPIRFRACFETELSYGELSETYVGYPKAEPLNAPYWFDCFEADALGAALASGDATALLGQANITYGIDQIVAIHRDGRGFMWHQINPCGEKLFDGEPVPEGCPPPPARN